MKIELFISFIMVLMLTSAAFAADSQLQTEVGAIKVVHFINGIKADSSFFDSAANGVAMAQKDLGLKVKTIEAGTDSAMWQPALENASENEDYDLMIVGSEDMAGPLQKVAQEHPDKKFIIYDASANYSNRSCENVYSVLFKQNEGSYLAGVYAGLMTKTGIIGLVGGMDTPVIRDFAAGYEQGAGSVRPDIQIIKEYAGSWFDPVKGEGLATSMYNQGADIIFQVAGATGSGVFKAAEKEGKYAIGVDSDQAIIVEQTDPDQAKVILTSMMKNVDMGLYRALKLYVKGTLPFGSAESLGINESGVGLARNKYYEMMTPDEVKARVDKAEKDIRDGKIVVDTAL
jgi:basic membrane protein A and related proteins